MVENQVGASILMEQLIHVATNELALNIVKDQVGANVLVKEPIHVATNGSPLNPLKKPMHVAINESGPLTLDEQVQHTIVFVPPTIVMTFLVRECYGSPKISIKFVKICQNLLKFVKIRQNSLKFTPE
jgi:hypothetical protein